MLSRIALTVTAAAAIMFIFAGSSFASVAPRPSCPVDEYGNCLSDTLGCDISCVDNGYDSIEGDGTWNEFDYYSNGGGRCAYAGAHRERHAPIGHLWTMYFQVYYCWNGSRITQITPIGPWGRDFIGSPWSSVYGVNWSTSTEPTGLGDGGTYAYSFTQMSFSTCFIGKPLCAPAIHPWIEIVVYNTGYAVCYSDVDFIGGCRGVKYR